ncbi:TPA: hypothetical protein QCQ12_003098 [Bacillus cereus biovar anthracis]|nr:hypothetical protein [Bacillus cereus biovar anthracis]
MGKVIDFRDRILDKLLQESLNKSTGKKYDVNRMVMLEDKLERVTELHTQREVNVWT